MVSNSPLRCSAHSCSSCWGDSVVLIASCSTTLRSFQRTLGDRTPVGTNVISTGSPGLLLLILNSSLLNFRTSTFYETPSSSMVNAPSSYFHLPSAGLLLGEVMTRVPSDKKTYSVPGATLDELLTLHTLSTKLTAESGVSPERRSEQLKRSRLAATTKARLQNVFVSSSIIT